MLHSHVQIFCSRDIITLATITRRNCYTGHRRGSNERHVFVFQPVFYPVFDRLMRAFTPKQGVYGLINIVARLSRAIRDRLYLSVDLSAST